MGRGGGLVSCVRRNGSGKGGGGEIVAVGVLITLGCGSLVEGKGSTRCHVVVVEGGDWGKRRLRRCLENCIFLGTMAGVLLCVV